jgi:Flp pilus assembly protein TadB
MERSSLYVVAVIMFLLLCYLAWSSPALIIPALSHPAGKKVFQAGLMLIAFGFYWSKKVTHIKI